MNSLNSKIAAVCISLLLVTPASRAWEVDLSRRQSELSKITNQDRLPASTSADETQSIFGQVFDSVEPTQDIVILNTEKGFVPDTIRLKKGNTYRIHVVNVNAKEKNVSFILDAFSEQHNTVFAQEKVFNLSPKVNGVFSYQCPETAMQGKVIVISSSSDSERKPASN